MKVKRKCTGPKYFSKKWEMEKATFGRPRFGEKSGQAERSVDLVQKMLGPCETENGANVDGLLHAAASRHKRARQNVQRIQVLEDGRILAKEEKTGRLNDKKRRINYLEGI